MPASGKIGNKGGGRKSLYEEKHKSGAINKLWEKVHNKVKEGEKLSEYEEKLVLSVLPKTIKTDSNLRIDTPSGLLVKIIDESKDSNNGDTD